MPLVLDLSQRLRLEALVHAWDTIDLAMHTLSLTGARLDETKLDLGHLERMAMFTAAWSIVDQVDAARQLVGKLAQGGIGPLTQSFLDLASTARLMRNGMDHLNQNIENIAASKEPRAPVFGSLSYLLLRDHGVQLTDQGVEVQSAYVVTLGTGTIGGRMPVSMPALNPVNALKKLGGAPVTAANSFQLSALGATLDLTGAANLLGSVMVSVASQFEEAFKAQAAAYAAETGMPEADVYKHPGAGLCIVLKFEQKGTAVGPASLQV